MAIPCTQHLGVKLCEALGLQADQVAGIAFRWTPGNVGTIEIEYYVSTNNLSAMEIMLREYKLVPKEVSE